MDSTLSHSDLICSALRVLSRLTDDEIRRDREVILPVVQRFGNVVSAPLAPIKSRSETAVGILNLATSRLPVIAQFVSKYSDLTSVILAADYSAVDDPRMVFLSWKGGKSDTTKMFLRALSTRYLARCYYERYGDEVSSIPNAGSRRHGKIGKFMSDEKITPSKLATNAISDSQKPRLLEEKLGTPGIWLVLSTVLSRFPHVHFTEIASMGALLSHGIYPEIMEAATAWSRLIDQCQILYTDHICERIQ
ncbi:hypothetical protein KXV55_005852 [Aspergillus fumigatus]|uniref:Uncharacterized protein n=1 Tax=Aspergillus turcosus TaxID=1245748 RepID=A0A229X7D6_9EURO|nr:hypothetical protein KXV55_005852 [Aspergillus fumigatus]RHZ69668.1 hypothetical protein CDV55_107352 [Aspergillus turcosus]RLL97569.1 hypothetical protein CFD26_106948 [Aspergillus turcosus]